MNKMSLSINNIMKASAMTLVLAISSGLSPSTNAAISKGCWVGVNLPQYSGYWSNACEMIVSNEPLIIGISDIRVRATFQYTLYWQSNGQYYNMFTVPGSNVDAVDVYQFGGNSYMSAHPRALGLGEKTPWDYEPMVAQGKFDANWVLDGWVYYPEFDSVAAGNLYGP
jgi:hypothetical protein